MHHHPHEFVVFRVQEQEFCLDVNVVREFRSATKAVPLPNSALEFKGLINLRGVVLPVVDMANKLGLPRRAEPANPVIIVAESANRLVGLEVDAVDDIISVLDGEIQPIPNTQAGVVHEFIRGVINQPERIICILDLDQLLPAEVVEAE